MEIQSASVSINQSRIQEDAAIQVQVMAQDAMKQQAAELEKLLASIDPNLGQNVNVLA
jgi:hypothetical protein